MPTEGLAGVASSLSFPDEDLSARSQHGDNCYPLCLLVYVATFWGGSQNRPDKVEISRRESVGGHFINLCVLLTAGTHTPHSGFLGFLHINSPLPLLSFPEILPLQEISKSLSSIARGPQRLSPS